MRNLLFQSIVASHPNGGDEEVEVRLGEEAHRTDADAEYVVSACEYISEISHGCHDRFATREECWPPIVPVEELPSSTYLILSTTAERFLPISGEPWSRSAASSTQNVQEGKEHVQFHGDENSGDITWDGFELRSALCR